MKASVDPDLCIGCGLCAGTCPDVFQVNDSGLAEAIAQPTKEQESCTVEARDNCPVAAISIED